MLYSVQLRLIKPKSTITSEMSLNSIPSKSQYPNMLTINDLYCCNWGKTSEPIDKSFVIGLFSLAVLNKCF